MRTANGVTVTDNRYTGQREEAELGLYYYVARWYDPVIMHFLQADTIVPEPGSLLALDRYAYVNYNPVRYIDPSGHKLSSGTTVDENPGNGYGPDDLGTGSSSGSGNSSQYYQHSYYGSLSTPSTNGSIASLYSKPPNYNFGDWFSDKYSGCFKCHAAVASGQIALTDQQLAEIHTNALELLAKGYTPIVAVMLVVGTVEFAPAVLEALTYYETVDCADGNCAATWVFGKNHSMQQWMNKMDKRGWTEQQISEALQASQQFTAQNLVNPGNPATRFVHPLTGRSVVIDEVTREIIHIGGDGFGY